MDIFEISACDTLDSWASPEIVLRGHQMVWNNDAWKACEQEPGQLWLDNNLVSW